MERGWELRREVSAEGPSRQAYIDRFNPFPPPPLSPSISLPAAKPPGAALSPSASLPGSPAPPFLLPSVILTATVGRACPLI